MKQVKVITRHAVANYGSLLQTYATQKVLEKLAYQAEIINYIPQREQGWNIVFVRSKTRGIGKQNPLKQLLFFASQIVNYSVSYFMFKKFRNRLMTETKLYSSFAELQQAPPQADIYLTGSDQVWGRMGPQPYDPAYFLDFVAENRKCVAYSASFGREEIEIDAAELVNLTKKYSAINVREKSAQEILTKHGRKDVKHVLDPTFLLTQDEWKSMAATDKLQKPYLLVYQLNQNRSFEDYAEKMGKKFNLPVLRLSCSMNSVLQKGKLIYLPCPSRFLQYFQNAQLILTDSFHATVFSLIFNRNFMVISPGKTSTRIKSILEAVKLEDRMMSDFEDFSWPNREINFANVNKRIDEMRQESIAILKESLQ